MIERSIEAPIEKIKKNTALVLLRAVQPLATNKNVVKAFSSELHDCLHFQAASKNEVDQTVQGRVRISLDCCNNKNIITITL